MRRRRKARRHIPAKYVLWFLSILCVAAMFASFLFDVPFTPLNTAAGYVFIPMQKGINEIGTWAGGVTDNLAKLRDVMKKNEELQAQVDELTTQLSTYQMEQYDIEDMRKLLDLDEQYKYEKVGAGIIGKDAGNWFDTFIIDKGSKDGIEAAIGDQVVTSYTSSKYLPGLLIGQINELNTDSNNLTKSGTITPAVDFEHIKNVLVILDKKQAVQSKEN